MQRIRALLLPDPVKEAARERIRKRDEEQRRKAKSMGVLLPRTTLMFSDVVRLMKQRRRKAKARRRAKASV